MESKFFLLLFWLISPTLLCQDLVKSGYVAKYDVVFLRDTSDVYSVKEEQMALYIGENRSLYKSLNKDQVEKLQHETLEKNIAAVKPGEVLMVDFRKLPKINIKHEVLKINDSVYIADDILTYRFQYVAENHPKWTILKDKKVINGYECRNAVTEYNGRTYEAWFTPEIPFSEGPYTFKGLPGLIVTLQDQKKLFYFELRSFGKEDTEALFRGGKWLSYKNFIKTRAEAKANIVGNLKLLLRKETMSKEEQELVKRNANRKNNYLD